AIAPFAERNGVFRAAIETRLARARADGGFDLAKDYGNGLLVDIICDLAEIPKSDRSSLYPMSRASWALDMVLSIPKRRHLEAIVSEGYTVFLAETRRQVAHQSDSFIGHIYRELLSGRPEEECISATAALLAVMIMMGGDALAGVVVGGIKALLNP